MNYKHLRNHFFAAAYATFLPVASYATVGEQSAGGGVLGPAYAADAAGFDFGRAVAFIQYGAGTATGTLVPSSELGVIKFLTAAHNVDSNNDGVLDAGAGNITLFFGNTPGTTGAGATYSVVATFDQIAVNPNWAPSAGSATHDMAVVSFSFAQITTVTGGATIQAAAVTSTSPLGLEAKLGGHGLFADGTVNLAGEENPEDQTPDAVPPGAQDVDGILKTGTNTVDFVGVPGAVAPPTIAPSSGTVILLDFDKSDGSTSTLGGTTGGPLEAGTAKGDSGSALFVDTNGDGKLEVTGVLNGGDNPFPTGASTFGDISQYAPVLTASNLAFLAGQNVFVGTSFAGKSAGEFGGAGFSIVDITAINNFNNGVATARQTQSHATQSISSHLGAIQTHVNRFNRGTSRLENVGGGEVGLDDIAGYNSGRWELWVDGDLGSVDTDPSGGASGFDSHFGAATVGIDFLATSYVIVGMTWSHLYGKSEAAVNNLSLESDGNALGFNISGNWGGLNSSLIYSYATSETDISRSVGAARAFASPDTTAHPIDWTLSYNFHNEGWVHGPTGGVRYTNGSIDPYTEASNIPVAGLMTVAEQDFEFFRFNAGYNVAYHIPIDDGKIVPYLGAALIHETRNNSNANAAFQGTPFYGIGVGGLVPFGTGPTAAVGVGDSDSTYLNVRGGVELFKNNGFSLNINGYINTYRDDMIDAGAGVQVGYSF
ncbi:MAG: autotransporter outer membrane beta-barrel domain-containing protein [Verrucomicrobiales bacterium]|nr:autotransporter outer membrane beta-barrel domain-containing protein [Verrucomicrobiales bacterium]HQW29048.1 autotransporter outer membrane beta-barrel domain-containing protein [Verrucomicrobiales bacterium]